jgi:hypothetical protein
MAQAKIKGLYKTTRGELDPYSLKGEGCIFSIKHEGIEYRRNLAHEEAKIVQDILRRMRIIGGELYVVRTFWTSS